MLSALKVHIYIIILCTHVYVLYTCTKKSEGPLLRINYWKYFFTKVFNKELQAFLYHEQLLWTVKEHHITSYEFFVSQQINSAIAVHLTPIKGQKKGKLLFWCMTEKGITSSEPPIYFFGLLSRILNIILESNSKGDIHWKFE